MKRDKRSLNSDTRREIVYSVPFCQPQRLFNMIKIWLDDIRTPPDDTWVWCKSVSAAYIQLISEGEKIISFDHDLGTEWSGYDLAQLLERDAGINGRSFNLTSWTIHSANPVGRKNIQAAMNSRDRILKACNSSWGV